MKNNIIILNALLIIIHNFTFIYPDVSTNILTINKVTTYTLNLQRSIDINLGLTNALTELVPTGSNITVIFPRQYNLVITVPIATQVTIDGQTITDFISSINGNNFTIRNAIRNASYIQNVMITISNVKNPWPALTTDSFVVVIGNDISADSSSSSVTLTGDRFASCGIAFNPGYVNTTAPMIVSITPANKMAINGYIQINFPPLLQWSLDISENRLIPIATASCSILSGQITSGSCTGQERTATIRFSILSANTSDILLPISFQINNLFSPPSTSPKDTLTITSFTNQNYQIDSCTTTIKNLIPQILTFSIIPNTNPLTVNSLTSLTLTFTLTDTIIKTDYFLLIFPNQSIYTHSAISTSNIQVIFSATNYTQSNNTLIMRQSATSNIRYAGLICRIVIASYRAPTSIKITQPFIFRIFNQQNGLKMQGTATIRAIAKIYPLLVTVADNRINQKTYYSLFFNISDTITSNGLISITFPTSVTLNISASCLLFSNIPSSLSPKCTLISPNIIQIRNLSITNISSGNYHINITSIANAVSALPNMTFSVNYYYQDNYQTLVATSTYTGATLYPKTFRSIKIMLSDYTVSASEVTMQITISPNDNILANGYIIIQIPTQFQIVNNYNPSCSLSKNSIISVLSCTLNNKIFNISLGSSNSISLNQTVILNLNRFAINPSSTRPTTNLNIYAYSPQYYLINYMNSSTSISQWIVRPFILLQFLSNNTINNANTNIRIYFKQFSRWQVNSYAILSLPTQIKSRGILSCTDLSNNAVIPCISINSSYINISIANANDFININLDYLINPSSFKPTAIINFTSYTHDHYIYATGQFSSIITNLPSLFTSFAYQFTNPIFNTSTDLIINITNTDIITSSYIIYNFIQFIGSANSVACRSESQTLICNLSGNNLIIRSGSSFNRQVGFTISNLLIPLANVTNMKVQSFHQNYLMSYFQSIQFISVCKMPCYTCQSINLTSVCLSCYSFTNTTTYIYLYEQNCYQKCPLGTFAALLSLKCQLCNVNCKQCSLSSNNCTECKSNTTNYILYASTGTCVSSCPNNTYIKNIIGSNNSITTCQTCQSPCKTCSSATYCLQCSDNTLFYFNGTCVLACPLNISIENVANKICLSCDLICLTCINQTSKCLSCNNSIAPLYIAQNFTCLNSCPSPLVIDNNLCVGCQSPCNTCVSNKNNCTSCLKSSSTFLSLLNPGNCILNCQKNYFSNSTSLACQLCSSVLELNCDNCFNSTACSSCNVGYVYFSQNRSCLPTTPIGYMNISGIAVACQNDCGQCIGQPNNCSACYGILSLFVWGGTGYCQSQCPANTLSINNICQNCKFPCLACSSSLANCSSCLLGYLFNLNDSKICISSCPNTTFIDVGSQSCQNCMYPCLNCFGQSNICSSCNVSINALFLYNHSCIESCPFNYFILNSACIPCISPCLSCNSISNNCTSCINSSFYYYQAINRCYLQCPLNLTIALTVNSINVCLTCLNNCKTCVGSLTACLSCNQNFSLFNSTCILQCPSGRYSNQSICAVCINNCLTCNSATYCLTCLNQYKLFNNMCLSICPVTHSIIINQACTSCAQYCLNCTELNFCYQCSTNSALYQGACWTTCPSPLQIYFNTSNSKLQCFTSSQITAQQLANRSLKLNAFLPFPFTILSTFLFLCCLMSKIQNIDTYLTGVGYSIYGCAEVGALLYLLYLYVIGYSKSDIYIILFICTLALIYLLNFISLTCITSFLFDDVEFKNWLYYKRRGTPGKQNSLDQDIESQQKQTNISRQEDQNIYCCSHAATFTIFTLLSFLISYKIKLLIFTKLFKFNCLFAHLKDVQCFRAFNILSFFGVIHQGLSCYISIKFLMQYNYSTDNELYIASIDCLLVTFICFIFALLTTQKQNNFFKIENNFKDGVDLGHRKKDKDKLKNLKITEDRMKGMNSRDKLIDPNDSHSDMQQEAIIRNHNINIPGIGKRNTDEWVQKIQVQETPARNIKNSQKINNIFDSNNEIDYQDNSYLPFNTKSKTKHHQNRNRLSQDQSTIIVNNKLMQGKTKKYSQNWVEVQKNTKIPTNTYKIDKNYNNYDEMSPKDRIQLFHTSVRPQKKERMANSNIVGNANKSSLINKGHRSQADQSKINNQISLVGVNKEDKGTQQHLIIKQTQQQINSSQKDKKPTSKNIQSDKFSDMPQKNIEPEHFDLTGENAQIVQTQDSILPFVHQDGILRDKQSKIIKVPIKKELINVDMSIFVNSASLDRQNRVQKDNSLGQFQDLLDMSEIKIERETQVAKDSHKKIQQSIQSSLHAQNNIKKPPLVIKKQRLNLQLKKAFNQAIPPQKNNTQGQITHAPKIYKSSKQLNADLNQDDFDDKLMNRQQQLLRIREQIRNTKLKKMALSQRSERKRSKKSIKVDYQGTQKKGDISSLLIRKAESNDEDDLQQINIAQQQNDITKHNKQKSSNKYEPSVFINPTQHKFPQAKDQQQYQPQNIFNRKHIDDSFSHNNSKQFDDSPQSQQQKTDKQKQNNLNVQQEEQQLSTKQKKNMVVQNKLKYLEQNQHQFVRKDKQPGFIKYIEKQNNHDTQNQNQIQIQNQKEQQQIINSQQDGLGDQEQLNNTDFGQQNHDQRGNSQPEDSKILSSKHQPLIDNQTSNLQIISRPNLQSHATQKYQPRYQHQQMEQPLENQSQEEEEYCQEQELQIESRMQECAGNVEIAPKDQIKDMDKTEKYIKGYNVDDTRPKYILQYNPKSIQNDEASQHRVQSIKNSYKKEQGNQFAVLNYEHSYEEEQSLTLKLSQQKSNKNVMINQRKLTKEQDKEQMNEHPIIFNNEKSYNQVFNDGDTNIYGKARKSKANLNKIQQQSHNPIKNGQLQKIDNTKIADLLKNVRQNSRTKRSMPKDDKDERIRIKLDKNERKIQNSRIKPQNTNLVRKSLQKNKPLEYVKQPNINQQISEDQSYQQRNKGRRTSRQSKKQQQKSISMNEIRQVKPENVLKTPYIQQKRNLFRPNHNEKEQSLQQFNFGDEISSEISKNAFINNFQQLQWRRQDDNSDSNKFVPDYYQNNRIPERPLMFNKGKQDLQIQQLQIIGERKEKRRSKRHNTKKKSPSRQKKSELYKIYGK